MCGIAGFIDFNNSSSISILKNCTDILTHRGPDGSGYEFFQNKNCQVGLGHRRLSIIDLSNAANQPMWYKNICIIFNGEIYNFKEIKSDLEKLGHHFITHSDTEVILHAWEQWGPKMIQMFIGMFAFVIYDEVKKEIYCFRDRAGIKPFFYYWHNGLFLFASELKSFHKHPGFKKAINLQAVHQFIQYGFIMAPLSIFNFTNKLLPGHYLKFNIRDASFTTTMYWDVDDAYNKPKLAMGESEAKKHTEQLLIAACKYRMIADVPVGIFLSGGYDSTAIVALLQANQTKKLKTFTIGFFEKKYNEAGFAKQVATHLQTDHTDYFCTPKEAQEIIPEIPFICDEPFGDASIIPTTLVSKLARKNVTVSLSADGGDELFGGYKKYALSLDFLKKINRLPGIIKKPVGKYLKSMPDAILVKLVKNEAISLKKERIADLFKESSISTPLIMDHLLSQTFSADQMRSLMNELVINPRSLLNPENGTLDNFGLLDKMLATDYKTYLPDDILSKVDRASMSTSLESREPLLDHHLLEFIARLPEQLKINQGQKKYLLKQIVHDYVPKELMDRPKTGFGIPVFSWLRNDLKYYTEEYMNERDFDKHGIFKKEALQNIKRRFFEGDKNYESIFWYLLIFQMWYKQWMD